MTSPGKKRHPFCWLPLALEVLCFAGTPFCWLLTDPADPAAGMDRASALCGCLLLGATLLGVVNLVWGAWLGLSGQWRLARRLGFWGKLCLGFCQGAELLVLLGSILAGALLFTFLIGPLGLLGTGILGAMLLGWLYFLGLGPSVYLIAFLWGGFRAGKLPLSTAVLHTLLQLVPVVDMVAAAVLFFTTRRLEESSGAQNLPGNAPGNT